MLVGLRSPSSLKSDGLYRGWLGIEHENDDEHEHDWKTEGSAGDSSDVAKQMRRRQGEEARISRQADRATLILLVARRLKIPKLSRTTARVR